MELAQLMAVNVNYYAGSRQSVGMSRTILPHYKVIQLISAGYYQFQREWDFESSNSANTVSDSPSIETKSSDDVVHRQKVAKKVIKAQIGGLFCSRQSMVPICIVHLYEQTCATWRTNHNYPKARAKWNTQDVSLCSLHFGRGFQWASEEDSQVTHFHTIANGVD